MRKYQVVIEVDVDRLLEQCKATDAEVGVYDEPTVEEAITREFNWLGQSGISLVEIQNEIV